MENRYIIGNYGNGIECFVTFDKFEMGLDGESCLIRIGNKIFRIPVLLLRIIAKPAP